MSNIVIISAIQNEAKKNEICIDTNNKINSEYMELAMGKRPTFDIPYTEVDPLR